MRCNATIEAFGETIDDIELAVKEALRGIVAGFHTGSNQNETGSYSFTSKVARFLNFYRCSECGEEWSNEDDYTCNDRCPNTHCGIETEPYKSEDA